MVDSVNKFASVRKSRLDPDWKCAMVPPRESTIEERQQLEMMLHASNHTSPIIALDCRAETVSEAKTPEERLAAFDLEGQLLDEVYARTPRRSARFDPERAQMLANATYSIQGLPKHPRITAYVDDLHKSNAQIKREAKQQKPAPKARTSGLLTGLMKRI